MDEFSKICTVLNTISNVAAEINQYRTWSDDFSRNQIDQTIECLKETGNFFVDVTKLTSEQCDTLLFSIWDEKSGLRLIPLYLYPFLRYGQELTSINGCKVMVTKEYTKRENNSELYIDNDHRCGVLAFGFVPLDKKVDQENDGQLEENRTEKIDS